MKNIVCSRIALLLILIALLPCQSLMAQLRSVHVNDSVLRTKNSGLVYNIPQTRLIIEVRIKKIEKEAGPYYEYAKAYLGIDKVVADNSVKYELGDIHLSTRPEPDPQNFYLVEDHCLPLFGHRNKIELTQEGYLKNLNVRRTSGRVQQPANHPEENGFTEQPAKQEPYGLPTYKVNTNLLKPEPVYIQVEDSNGNMVQQKIEPKFETDDNTRVAKEAAESLAKIKESLQNLLSGYQEVNYEHASLQLMTDALRKMEAGWLKLFIGNTKESEQVMQYTYLPSRDEKGPAILCYFSEKTGLSDKATAGSVPLVLTLKMDNLIPDWKFESKSKKKPSLGLAYRIPAKVSFNLGLGDKQLKSGQIMISQLGQISFLPKKVKEVKFFPNTGGIREIKIK